MALVEHVVVSHVDGGGVPGVPLGFLKLFFPSGSSSPSSLLPEMEVPLRLAPMGLVLESCRSAWTPAWPSWAVTLLTLSVAMFSFCVAVMSGRIFGSATSCPVLFAPPSRCI